jgi:nicotinamidase-related amidase
MSGSNDYLVVIDMQNDFVDGALGTDAAAAIVPGVCEKISSHAGPVLFTCDTHGPGYLGSREGVALPVEHCIEGTRGWELAPAIDALREAKRGPVFRKGTFGSVELAEYLRKANEETPIDSVELVGLCTDICVISNALMLRAFLPETRLVVDASCCAGVTPESHAVAIDAMRACQIAITGE